MKKIGGNKTAVIQIKDSGGQNEIGENIENWMDAIRLKGFLDFNAGQNEVNQYNAKLQDTTHLFFADFDSLETVTDNFLWDPFKFTEDIIVTMEGDKTTVKATSENCRVLIDGNIYNCLLIDDPMGMHQHLEFYLGYIGGGLGV